MEFTDEDDEAQVNALTRLVEPISELSLRYYPFSLKGKDSNYYEELVARANYSVIFVVKPQEHDEVPLIKKEDIFRILAPPCLYPLISEKFGFLAIKVGVTLFPAMGSIHSFLMGIDPSFPHSHYAHEYSSTISPNYLQTINNLQLRRLIPKKCSFFILSMRNEFDFCIRYLPNDEVSEVIQATKARKIKADAKGTWIAIERLFCTDFARLKKTFIDDQEKWSGTPSNGGDLVKYEWDNFWRRESTIRFFEAVKLLHSDKYAIKRVRNTQITPRAREDLKEQNISTPRWCLYFDSLSESWSIDRRPGHLLYYLSPLDFSRSI